MDRGENRDFFKLCFNGFQHMPSPSNAVPSYCSSSVGILCELSCRQLYLYFLEAQYWPFYMCTVSDCITVIYCDNYWLSQVLATRIIESFSYFSSIIQVISVTQALGKMLAALVPSTEISDYLLNISWHAFVEEQCWLGCLLQLNGTALLKFKFAIKIQFNQRLCSRLQNI